MKSKGKVTPGFN